MKNKAKRFAKKLERQLKNVDWLDVAITVAVVGYVAAEIGAFGPKGKVAAKFVRGAVKVAAVTV